MKSRSVGDKGQQYEVTVYDEGKRKRIVIGWFRDEDQCIRVCESIVTRPGWSDARYRDRYNVY